MHKGITMSAQTFIDDAADESARQQELYEIFYDDPATKAGYNLSIIGRYGKWMI